MVPQMFFSIFIRLSARMLQYVPLFMEDTTVTDVFLSFMVTIQCNCVHFKTVQAVTFSNPSTPAA